jgi:hypothetical protein
MRRALVIALLLVPAAAAFAEPDPAALRARITGPPEGPSCVGEQVVFSVTLSLVDRPRGTPQFQLPGVSGGLLVPVAGRPVYGNEKRDGVEFMTWSYTFAFYPHREGEHTIPAIGVRVRLPRGDGTWRKVSAGTEPFTVSARLPAGARGLSTLVSTREFEAEETWNPKQEEFRVGDAIRRTITQRAPDVLGMGLPPVSFREVAGATLYPEAPSVNDETYRGDVQGERVDTVVYILEREGDLVLPGVVIPWFDLETEKLRAFEFPPRRIRVAPNPSLAVAGESPPKRESATSLSSVLVPLVVVAAILLLAALAYRRLRGPITGWAATRRRRIESSEAHRFKGVLTAARAGDARGLINRAAGWLPKVGVRTLTEFADRFGDSEMRRSIDELMETCFGREGGAWDDPALAGRLEEARCRALIRRAATRDPLPRTLNP